MSMQYYPKIKRKRLSKYRSEFFMNLKYNKKEPAAAVTIACSDSLNTSSYFLLYGKPLVNYLTMKGNVVIVQYTF